MANVTPSSLVPETTLQRLAPRREGIWFVTGQAEDHFTLAYVRGTHALTYHIYPCNTEEDVIEVCGHLMYTYSGYPVNVTGGTFLRRSETSSQPLHLVLRPRQEEPQEQEHVVQNLAGINLSTIIPLQDQVAAAPQSGLAAQSQDQVGVVAHSPQNSEYHLTQTTANGQSQYQMINTAEGNGTFGWSVTSDIFNEMDPMVGDHNNDHYGALSADDAMLGSIFNEYSSIAGDMPLSGGDAQAQIEWNLFTND